MLVPLQNKFSKWPFWTIYSLKMRISLLIKTILKAINQFTEWLIRMLRVFLLINKANWLLIRITRQIIRQIITLMQAIQQGGPSLLRKIMVTTKQLEINKKIKPVYLKTRKKTFKYSLKKSMSTKTTTIMKTSMGTILKLNKTKLAQWISINKVTWGKFKTIK